MVKVTSQAEYRSGYRGMQEVVALCTVAARDDSDDDLKAHLADLYERISESEEPTFFFTEFSTSFLAVVTALLEQIGCEDEYEKLRVFQVLALTTENHFKKDDYGVSDDQLPAE